MFVRDLSLHILDIIQNSITADATKVVLNITIDKNNDKLTVCIEDNGSGMSKELLKDITSPFSTTRKTRKVGLGISLLMASAERADGELSIQSTLGIGTTVTASFKITHIDRLPLGDISETIVSVILTKPEMDLEIELKSTEETFKFDTAEVKERIVEIPITEPEVLTWIKDFINEGVKIILGGVLDEVHS
jgi:signal transduction histidine kinase